MATSAGVTPADVADLEHVPRRATMELLALQSDILARAAQGVHVRELLDAACRMIEDPAAGMRCTILLVDGEVLRHGAAPSMDAAYTEAIDGLEWGPDVGSCGTTAHTGQTTIVADIATDPKWALWADLALGFGLRACWSVPVRSRDGEVMATFACYSDTPRRPDDDELELLEHAAMVLSVLLEQQRDRDAREELTSRLERANTELVRSSRAKDDFLSMTSHELRTPLTPMLGMLETLQGRWDDLERDEVRSLIDVVARQAQRMQHLVDDLLTMSAASAGELRATPEQVRLRDAAEQAVVGILGPDATVAVDVPEDLVALVDPHHLQQVLQNFLTNAVKYAPPGPTQVRGRRDDGHVALEVLDVGPGVPDHLVPRLFDLFTQADSGDRRTARGTGIGLAVVRTLARINGGRAWYAPRPDGGSCFGVALRVPPTSEVN